MKINDKPTILLIRHAETQWNTAARLQGWQDAPLTLNGFRQACAVADNLREIGCELRSKGLVEYHVSPLGRACQTASILADSWDIDYASFVKAEQIKERNYGFWEGLTLDEIARTRPDEFAAHRNDPWEYVVPNGESKKQLFERIGKWLTGLKPDKTHVVVTHSGCFRAIRGLYTGATREEIDGFRELQTTSYLLSDGGEKELPVSPKLAEKFQLDPNIRTVAI